MQNTTTVKCGDALKEDLSTTTKVFICNQTFHADLNAVRSIRQLAPSVGSHDLWTTVFRDQGSAVRGQQPFLAVPGRRMYLQCRWPLGLSFHLLNPSIQS